MPLAQDLISRTPITSTACVSQVLKSGRLLTRRYAPCRMNGPLPGLCTSGAPEKASRTAGTVTPRASTTDRSCPAQVGLHGTHGHVPTRAVCNPPQATYVPTLRAGTWLASSVPCKHDPTSHPPQGVPLCTITHVRASFPNCRIHIFQPR